MSAQKDQMEGQTEPTQPYPTQPYPTQPYPTQPYPTQSYPTQPYPTQPYPTQPYPTQPYPDQACPSPSDISANQNVYDPPAYDAPSYPPPQDSYDMPQAPPPGYGDGPSSSTTLIVIVENVPEEESDFLSSDGMLSFNEKSVRLGFIRKVYGILALQMAITVGISCLFMFHTPTKDFVQSNIGVYVAAYAIFFVICVLLVCGVNECRKYPCNMIALGIFTFSLAYVVATVTSFHDTKIVLMVFGITLVVCTAVMLFACQTKYDFTTCVGLLFVLSSCLVMFGIYAGILVPMGSMKITHMAYAGLGALLYMGYLAYYTQLIIGGRKYLISPEDYVFAAMMLYGSVIMIVVRLLLLRGGRR